MSRADRMLKYLCLFVTRSQAAAACKEGRVLVDGAPVRAAQEIRVGQRILIRDRMGMHEMEVEIHRVPERQVPRKNVDEYATVTRRQREPLDGVITDQTPGSDK
ncbi:MAG: hypothetical protein KJ970_07440 [Candidatus Eisenbacteria bacterium]|uniref:RNA-binding S4 domain-containing protein n=1 Tax=Eiseniibacteriota bacterium TaxID=2212470 RepID=A0A948RXA4_UNCEI|nr:hypothetical protein [Candidatus Eisenbacteria bacterium]MBU1949591.1 hypothetical protein [Candidatus Eisenbacteria bacterium]MBU2690747.1 hypothetical protein [Candidatus Eisenbacteria bacterium]